MKTTKILSCLLLSLITIVSIGFPSFSQNLIDIELVSIATDGTQSDRDTYIFAISGDGRYVAFISNADNLVPSDTNGTQNDIFIRDRLLNETSLLLVGIDNTQIDGAIYALDISDDGRYIAFSSTALNLVEDTPTDNCANEFSTYFCGGTFVHDRITGETIMVSVSSDGIPANAFPESVSISGNGRYVMFHPDADNLVPDDDIICVDLDNRNCPDVFVHDIVTGETKKISVASDGSHANHLSLIGSFSYDGRYVAFLSHATNFRPTHH